MVIQCHIIAAAMKSLGMSSMEDFPLNDILPAPDLIWMESNEYRKEVLHGVCLSIADSLPLGFSDFKEQKKEDKVNVYANQLLTLGCFYMEYSDAIREGDGRRGLRCWRFLLPMFVSSGRKNYALESLKSVTAT